MKLDLHKFINCSIRKLSSKTALKVKATVKIYFFIQRMLYKYFNIVVLR